MTGIPFIETLLWSNLRIALLVGIVYGALRVLGTGDGAFRHRVWLTALAGCLLLPLLGALVPSLSIPILPAPEPEPPLTLSFASGELATDEVSSSTGVATLPGPFGSLWLWVYAVGVAAVLGLFVVSVWRMARLERRMAAWEGADAIRIKDAVCAELGIRRPVSLLGCDAAGSPFTWRVWRPSVVLPSSAGEWSPDRMRNALLHELCHVKRFDWAWLWLLRIAAAIYWFNPLVWVAIRECRFEAERACDDFVLGAGGDSADYAEQLVDLMASSRASRGVGIALGGGFPKRIRAILNASQEVRVMGRIERSVFTSATALLVTVLAACQVTTGQAVSDEDTASAERALQEQRRIQTLAEEERRQARDREVARQRELEAVAREEERARQRAAEASARGDEREAARQRAMVEALAAQQGARAETEQRLQLAELARALEQRTADLREREMQMERLAQTVERLQVTIDQQSAELLEAERALAQLQAQLAETANP